MDVTITIGIMIMWERIESIEAGAIIVIALLALVITLLTLVVAMFAVGRVIEFVVVNTGVLGNLALEDLSDLMSSSSSSSYSSSLSSLSSCLPHDICQGWGRLFHTGPSGVQGVAGSKSPLYSYGSFVTPHSHHDPQRYRLGSYAPANHVLIWIINECDELVWGWWVNCEEEDDDKGLIVSHRTAYHRHLREISVWSI